ncbi:uncharacterized protein MYCFIDRAFT_175658 [Pseudocercospora fijiensis CIRAD86]|uniref:Uncharacterized protein n=1 Tax=Pseudocercospora fijiensis (strain CIRAD86) TaxID=383855 RepID=M3AXA7_PSEFD|nr:uncharacterized protein MYCFIDRAFT_175658 [Pseudocercospora fijiensis CIRAD86]EME82107.1 hypothetical protein MYCFIDRAFT_175658 [Pseudocercospora fijiensis CIRAD86]
MVFGARLKNPEEDLGRADQGAGSTMHVRFHVSEVFSLSYDNDQCISQMSRNSLAS